jgi:hypothetical protein
MEHVDKIGASATQRAIGAAMAYEAKHGLADQAGANKLGYSGFKDYLIAGGQNGWAMVHIQGVAGASLAGYQSAVDNQFKEDKNQLKVGLDWKAMGRTVIPYAGNTFYPLDKYLAEKKAEIADDEAGLFVAGALYEKMNGQKDFILTKVKIFNLLCDK